MFSISFGRFASQQQSDSSSKLDAEVGGGSSSKKLIKLYYRTYEVERKKAAQHKLTFLCLFKIYGICKSFSHSTSINITPIGASNCIR